MMMRRGWTAAATVGLLVGVSLVVAEEDSAAGPVETVAAGYGYDGFALTVASASGMYPGKTQRLAVRAANPYHFPIEVRDVQAYVDSTSRRKCRPNSRNLIVTASQERLPRRLEARQRGKLPPLTVSMPMDASVECASANFLIKVRARAVRTGR